MRPILREQACGLRPERSNSELVEEDGHVDPHPAATHRGHANGAEARLEDVRPMPRAVHQAIKGSGYRLGLHVVVASQVFASQAVADAARRQLRKCALTVWCVVVEVA